MLAKFAVSLGLGWAGLELLVPAVSPGLDTGKSKSRYLQAVSVAAKVPGGLGDPAQQCRGWTVLPQVSCCSQDWITSAPCDACAVAVMGDCPGHISPPL